MTRARIISLVVTIFVLLTVFSGCVRKTEKKETQSGSGVKKIVVGFNESKPVAYVEDDGSYTEIG